MQTLLEIKNLDVRFMTDDGELRAVDRVSFELGAGETLGLVGESGCGKSVTALSIMRLVPSPPGRITGGEILFHGEDLLGLPQRRMRKVRGSGIGMVFQDPMTSLNPYLTVEIQLIEGLRLHQGLTAAAARARAAAMLDRVGIPDPGTRLGDYPHQFSGGMRQRVMIAQALCLEPRLLIADEPTTALDVTTQARFFELVKGIQAETGIAIMLITHDLGIVAGVCDRVLVMYAGRIVESAPTRELYADPGHPYTHGLLQSVPRLDAVRDRLVPIPGSPPSLINPPPGCRFEPRCPWAMDRCRTQAPELAGIGPGRMAACHLGGRIPAPDKAVNP